MCYSKLSLLIIHALNSPSHEKTSNDVLKKALQRYHIFSNLQSISVKKHIKTGLFLHEKTFLTTFAKNNDAPKTLIHIRNNRYDK